MQRAEARYRQVAEVELSIGNASGRDWPEAVDLMLPRSPPSRRQAGLEEASHQGICKEFKLRYGCSPVASVFRKANGAVRFQEDRP